MCENTTRAAHFLVESCRLPGSCLPRAELHALLREQQLERARAGALGGKQCTGGLGEACMGVLEGSSNSIGGPSESP